MPNKVFNSVNMTLSEREQERYQRHLQLKGFSESGQKSLKSSKVLIVGLGGLGCPAAQYLVAAGVGQITLLDGDLVSLSNLQRQILFTEDDLGSNKAVTAKNRLKKLNSDIDIFAIDQYLTVEHALRLIKDVDLVLDCTDNFSSRYLINDICAYYQTPWLYASVLGFNGQLALFKSGQGCFRCLFPQAPADVPDCNQAGVLGAVPGVLGSLQAVQALHYLKAKRTYFEGSNGTQMLQFSAQTPFNLKAVQLQHSPQCPMCTGESNYQNFLKDYPKIMSQDTSNLIISAVEFVEFVNNQSPVLVDVRDPHEHQERNLGGINIPLTELKNKALDLWNKDDLILVYCRSGKRSLMAVNELLALGFDNVKTLCDGIDGQPK